MFPVTEMSPVHSGPAAHIRERRLIGPAAFTVVVPKDNDAERILRLDAYSAAMAFIRGQVSIDGDLSAAIRYFLGQPTGQLRRLHQMALARCSRSRLAAWARTRSVTARQVSFHYDRSNEFYAQFLDSRMVYSCAYFRSADVPLEEAQLAKLDYICRKLSVLPGERFLDVGCGWGGLLIRCAERYGAQATGCTVSSCQAQYVRDLINSRGLQAKTSLCENDYRDMTGQYDKIASVGMFEHEGKHRLGQYFRRIHALLQDDGLFLNHGIVRPENVKDGPETLFLQREVFPGGELVSLSDVVRQAGEAGFEVLDIENVRPHYALTCRAWAQRLQHNADQCRRLIGETAYRTWLLFITASALSFEDGVTDVFQVLLAKRRRKTQRRLTRDYLYTNRLPVQKLRPRMACDPDAPHCAAQEATKPRPEPAPLPNSAEYDHTVDILL
jgi:cyclopropane-fatty-acyl-phospholipid synthase